MPRFFDLGTTLANGLPVGIHEAGRHQSSDSENTVDEEVGLPV